MNETEITEKPMKALFHNRNTSDEWGADKRLLKCSNNWTEKKSCIIKSF